MDLEIPTEVQDVKENDEIRDGKGGQKDGMTGEKVGLDGEGSASGKKQETKADEKAIVKMSDKYNEDDADLTIITSDSVAFKVHSIVISRVSPVLKSMIGLAKSSSQRDLITLSDQYVEHSLVVRAAFDIIYDREIYSFSHRNTLFHVVEFARKWDIPVISKVMLREIKLQCPGSKYCFTMFFLAIELDDPDIIAMVVKQMSSRLWGVKEATSPIPSDSKILPYRSVTVKRPSFRAEVLLSVSGTHVCDLGGWSWATFDSTPKPILWAMLRARRAAQADGKVDRWSQMSGEMKKVLAEMYPQESPNTNQAPSAGEDGEGAV